MLMHGSGACFRKKNPGKEFQKRDYAETNSRKGVLRKSGKAPGKILVRVSNLLTGFFYYCILDIGILSALQQYMQFALRLYMWSMRPVL